MVKTSVLVLFWRQRYVTTLPMTGSTARMQLCQFLWHRLTTTGSRSAHMSHTVIHLSFARWIQVFGSKFPWRREHNLVPWTSGLWRNLWHKGCAKMQQVKTPRAARRLADFTGKESVSGHMQSTLCFRNCSLVQFCCSTFQTVLCLVNFSPSRSSFPAKKPKLTGKEVPWHWPRQDQLFSYFWNMNVFQTTWSTLCSSSFLKIFHFRFDCWKR